MNNFIILIFIISKFRLTHQSHIDGCEEEYFLCNNTKCSKYGFCFYNTYDNKYEINKNFSAECICKNGYDTFYPFKNDNNNEEYISSSNNITKCCYRSKECFTVFLLECFIGFGFGYLYLENYNFFIFKFFFQIFICCVVYLSGYCLDIKNNINNNKNRKSNKINSHLYLIFNIINFIFIGVFIVWKITDFFIFGLNMVKDVNGMPLNNKW